MAETLCPAAFSKIHRVYTVYYGLKAQDILASALLILTILLSFFNKTSILGLPVLCKSSSESLQHPM